MQHEIRDAVFHQDIQAFQDTEIDASDWEAVKELFVPDSNRQLVCTNDQHRVTRLIIDNEDEFQKIPDEIGQLEFLEQLDLSESSIDELPQSISNLTRLIELDLSNSSLRELPDEIGDLQNLVRLDLNMMQMDMQGTSFTALPDAIGRLASLQFLDLKGSHITELPSSIGDLRSLSKLDLSFTFNLRTLPPTLGQLLFLKYLNLHASGIRSLPSTIGQLRSLTHLNLSVTKKLCELPHEIGNLLRLQELRLKHSSVAELPEEIGNLARLERLHMARSSIKSLPQSFLRLTNLIYLDAEEFKGSLADMEYLPKNLILLDLSMTKTSELSLLPNALAKLKRLRFLELNDLSTPLCKEHRDILLEVVRRCPSLGLVGVTEYDEKGKQERQHLEMFVARNRARSRVRSPTLPVWPFVMKSSVRAYDWYQNPFLPMSSGYDEPFAISQPDALYALLLDHLDFFLGIARRRSEQGCESFVEGMKRRRVK